jgi:transcriptional regulator with XRE-family HTH domain
MFSHVRELREALGLSQNALAIRAGVSLSSVGLLDTATRWSDLKGMRLTTLRGVAKALGVSVLDMLPELQKESK